MAHLTHSPFHKPSPFDVPAHPLTPPDTEHDFVGPFQQHRPAAPPPPMEFDSSFISSAPTNDPSALFLDDQLRRPSLSSAHTSPPGVGPASTSSFRYPPQPTDHIAAETSGAGRLRSRLSNLAYRSSSSPNLRESSATPSRDRLKSAKSFVVVIPPSAVTRDHGPLGLTLSSGPSHRLAHGVLMPLFPTMYAQLSAIAKEFNFPSTTGLCVYLHIREDGITITPRVSDETWQLLWTHAFEERAQPTSLPIAGRIEFDIDFRKARWYPAWVAASHRDSVQVEIPRSISGEPRSRRPRSPSETRSRSRMHPTPHSPSRSHAREVSHLTLPDDAVSSSTHGITPTQAPSHVELATALPAVRHVPRRLSLIDRLDTDAVLASLQSQRRPSLEQTERSSNSRIAAENALRSFTLRTLAPISQADEPRTAVPANEKEDLEVRVNSWRQSASQATTPLPAAVMPHDIATVEAVEREANMEDALNARSIAELFPHSSLELAPIDIEIEIEAGEELGSVLNLDEFDWSVSSAGPPSAVSSRPSLALLAIPYTPSVHLADRVAGSVIMTPTTCTSWIGGPSDTDSVFDYYASCESALPSPDLGQRMLEDAPCTPTTATSWGAPSYYTEEYDHAGSIQYAQSIDLGMRQVFSRSVTPATATSWGAPSEYAQSITYSPLARSVDIAQRSRWSRPATPSTATSWGAPSSYPPTPASVGFVNFVRSPGVGQRAFDVPEAPSRIMSFPYYDPMVGTPSGFTWPHYQPHHAEQHRGLELIEEATSPVVGGVVAAGMLEAIAARRVLSFAYYTAQKEDNRAEVSAPASLSPSRYPHLVIYPAAYPNFDLYPARAVEHCERTREASVGTLAYPRFNLYPAVYPNFDLYPGVAGSLATEVKPSRPSSPALSSRSEIPTHSYPHLAIYPAVYPFFNLYPAAAAAAPVVKSSGALRLPCAYPVLDIYPAVYRHFDLYPGLTTQVNSIAAKTKNDVEAVVELAPSAINVAVKVAYPLIRLSAALYPHNLAEIYPSVAPVGNTQVDVRLKVVYPAFDLYPAVYPFFHLYPSVEHSISRPSASSSLGLEAVDSVTKQTVNVRLVPAYPTFNLYPAIYPVLDIYPACSVAAAKVVHEEVVYPFFNLYPAVYPHFNLYPSKLLVQGAVKGLTGSSKIVDSVTKQTVDVHLVPAYPTFNLYPAVYPVLDIYPACSVVTSKSKANRIKVVYPFFNLYPAVYPHFNLYPSTVKNSEVPAKLPSTSPAMVTAMLPAVDVLLSMQYPTFDLYPAVYPHFDLYRACSSIQQVKQSTSVKLSPSYPSFDLYPAVYPYFDLYPRLLTTVVAPTLHVRRGAPKRQLSVRHTHAELHAIVMMEDNKLIRPSPPRHRRTHLDLHREVFPSVVSTPSGTTSPSTQSSPSSDKSQRASFLPDMGPPPLKPRARSGSIATRPPVPPRLISKHLSPPPALKPPSSILGRASSASVVPSTSPLPSGVKRERPTSMMDPHHPLHGPHHRKRDSLELLHHRPTRGMETLQEEASQSHDPSPPISRETLSQFPLPPMPRLPPLPGFTVTGRV